MRLPRVRFTVLRLMVVVAGLALVLTLARYVFIDNSPGQLLASILCGDSTI